MRSTLARVEESEAPDQHEAVRKLRRSVVLTLAERELRASAEPEDPTAEDSAA